MAIFTSRLIKDLQCRNVGTHSPRPSSTNFTSERDLLSNYCSITILLNGFWCIVNVLQLPTGIKHTSVEPLLQYTNTTTTPFIKPWLSLGYTFILSTFYNPQSTPPLEKLMILDFLLHLLFLLNLVHRLSLIFLV